ncbi:hypothetical protein ERJ75_000099700 [Trypanosoma vivax]|nr:hypothetical protein ERJ75_000099700 [Trypanosoma vivax]
MRRAIWLLCVVGWVAHEKCAGTAIAGLKGTTAAKLCTIAEALGEACTASRRVSLSLSEAEVRLATRAGLLDAMATVHDMSAQGVSGRAARKMSSGTMRRDYAKRRETRKASWQQRSSTRKQSDWPKRSCAAQPSRRRNT